MARKRKPLTTTISITFPTRLKRFRCFYYDDNGKWHRHQATEGEHLTICPETWCLHYFCDEHWPAHENEHMMRKLSNEER